MIDVSHVEVTTALEHALGVLESSQRILANNVANANTPNFTPTRVSFAESLQRAIQNTHSFVQLAVTNERHIALGAVHPDLVMQPDTYAASRNDQSKFDVDTEMVELEKNSSRYEILSGILRSRYQQMREVLRIP